jgi:phage shock protein PspC (stress-responsive transcriptional regulator)
MSRPRLTTSPDRVFFGVCGGVAEYFGWEANRVRTATVVVAIFTAVLPAMAIYAMLYYVMPDNDF